MTAPELSIAIPCYNEAAALRDLLAAVTREAGRLGLAYEIVITDDASNDGSWELLKTLAAGYPALRIQRLAENSGESAASFAAIQSSRGRIIVTLDADLQNDPRELPKFIEAIKGADCVCGTRQASRAQSDSFAKNVISRCSNWIRRHVLDDPVTDAGCTYRALRRECVADIPFFRGVHRFLPILLHARGYRVVEIPVVNQARHSGASHYGVFARFGAIVDMFAVRWMKSRMRGFRIAERTPD
jgi:glycosyltransferase involved in cell wall biosynthesis